MQARLQAQLPRDHCSEPAGATGQRRPGAQDKTHPTWPRYSRQGLYIPRRGLYTPPWPLHTPPWPLHTAVAFIHPTVASTHTTVVLTGRPVGEDVSGIISPGPGAGVSPRLSAVGGLPRPREGQGCFTSLPPWVLWMPLGPEAHTPSAVTGPSTRLAPQPPQALPIGYHLTRYWTVVRVLLVECLQSGFFREALAHV